ncbi:hypothetical protein [Streptomyces sp. NPDC052012]|uniref:hypothetical protein n=1 Tax=Streptomyces sp. NPDC052012 TaxID=3155051 RepID=UPI00344C44D8
MGHTPRRRRPKPSSGRFVRTKRNVRNEKFRDMNRFGKPVIAAFIGLVFVGYLLIFRPSVHVTVSAEAVTILGGALSGAVFRLVHNRRYRH